MLTASLNLLVTVPKVAQRGLSLYDERALLAQIQSGICCNSQAPFRQAATQPAVSKPAPMHGVILPQVPKSTPFLPELHEVSIDTVPKIFKVTVSHLLCQPLPLI